MAFALWQITWMLLQAAFHSIDVEIKIDTALACANAMWNQRENNWNDIKYVI